MKQQIQWLVERVESRQARITVTVDNNVISGGDISRSPTQQGVNSQQEQRVKYAMPSKQDLTTLVDLLEQNIGDLGLDSADRRKVNPQLATINAQLIDEPNPSIIREAFCTVKSITEGVQSGQFMSESTIRRQWEVVSVYHGNTDSFCTQVLCRS